MMMKTFFGPSMASLMQQVRKEIGDDALIIDTRQEKDGIWLSVATSTDIAELNNQAIVQYLSEVDHSQEVEVNEQKADNEDVPFVAQSSMTMAQIQQPITAMELSAGAQHMYALVLRNQLKNHGLPEKEADAIMRRCLQAITKDPTITPDKILSGVLNGMTCGEPDDHAIVALAGINGSGKTTTLLKMALAMQDSGTSAAVIFCAPQKEQAIQSMMPYVRALNGECHFACTPTQLSELVDRMPRRQKIFIDLPSVNLCQESEMAGFGRWLSSLDAQTYWVQQGGAMYEDMEVLARGLKKLGIKRGILTKRDILPRLGGLFGLMKHHDTFRWKFYTEEPGAKGYVKPLNDHELALLLLQPLATGA